MRKVVYNPIHNKKTKKTIIIPIIVKAQIVLKCHSMNNDKITKLLNT